MVSRVLSRFPRGDLSAIILLCYISAVTVVPLNSEITVEMVSMSFVGCGGGVCVSGCAHTRMHAWVCYFPVAVNN